MKETCYASFCLVILGEQGSWLVSFRLGLFLVGQFFFSLFLIGQFSSMIGLFSSVLVPNWSVFVCACSWLVELCVACLGPEQKVLAACAGYKWVDELALDLSEAAHRWEELLGQGQVRRDSLQTNNSYFDESHKKHTLLPECRMLVTGENSPNRTITCFS